MAKPRIIIADTDTSFINPMQLKFVEEFFDQIDLELITDPEYFSKLFSMSQKAAILIVSEDLYDINIQRHNIANVFLMTESKEEDSTADLNVSRVHKYISIKEIFAEIVGKSGESLNISNESKKDPQIISICSASGGVGKTTVALGVSACLTRNYKRVLYISADRLQTFQRLLETPGPISATDVYAKLTVAEKNAFWDIRHVIRKETFSYLPPFKASLMSLGLQYSVFEKIAVSAKESREYDYVIVDTDTTFDEDKARLMDISDKVVVVTQQSSTAVYATNVWASNINGLNSEKFLFVCNKFDRDRENALVSPGMDMKFVPNEYINLISHYDQMKPTDFAKESGIQKVAFLIM